MVFDNSSNELKGLDMEVLLPRLVAAGLEGIEARYPYYPADLTARLMEIAASLGLITTGGTDFHKHDGNNTGPGDVWVPLSVVTALKERLERRRAH
jgi:predicted metal-dependent phosphoesterase TrpH